jgi:hypothetical protein
MRDAADRQFRRMKVRRASTAEARVRADRAYSSWCHNDSGANWSWYQECEAKVDLARHRANIALTAYIRLYNAANAVLPASDDLAG